MYLYFKGSDVILTSNKKSVIVDNDKCVFVDKYDENYTYTLVNNVVVKGDLIVEDNK